MNDSRNVRSPQWPLLLIFAAVGFWVLGDMYFSRSLSDGPASGGGDITFTVSEDPHRIRVNGLPPRVLGQSGRASTDLSQALQIFALTNEQQWDSTMLAIDGKLEITGEGVDFIPRHPWLPGVRYHVRLSRGVLAGVGQAHGGGSDAEAEVIDTSFTVRRAERGERGRVTGVYPSADTLPQNLLKFYIHFSQPMTRGEAYRHISILNEDGEKVPDAFLELPQELWDPEARRLTILFDPGRIKRGLQRHNELGVAFQPGRRYTLAVDSTLRDGDGSPLAGSFRKDFVIAQPDRRMPDPETWTITAPEAGSTAPLEVRFDEPMDHALVRRLITLKRNGQEIAGAIELSDAEQVWRFLPDSEWRVGSYELEIGRVVEDLAGNNLISVFDVDLGVEGTQAADSTDEAVTMEIRILP